MINLAMRSIGLGLIAGWAAASTAAVHDPTGVLASSTAPYERGVQAYFAGRFSEAQSHLSQAIEAHPDDPRCYYFRALSLMRLGRSDYARGDLLVGADVEASAGNRFAVGAALERVQGPHRLLLEQYRRRARAESGSQAVHGERPGRRRVQSTSYVDDAAMLRQRVLVPLERFSQPPNGQTARPGHSSGRAQPSTQTGGAGPPAEVGTPAARSAPEDPFRDDVPPRDESPATQRRNVGQPSAESGPAPAAEPSSPESAPEAEDDPFREL